MANAAQAANIVMVLLLILGIAAAILGLTPPAQRRYPQLFTAGIVMVVVGFVMLVVLLVLGTAGV
jgi:hypothetical protein